MIGPARYRYWSYPTAVRNGTLTRTPRTALNDAFPMAPVLADRTVSNCYDLNFFRLQFRPRSKSEEPRRESIVSIRDACVSSQWMDFCDIYSISFTVGIAGDKICGRDDAVAMQVLAEATVIEFFQAAASFLNLKATAFSLLYDAPTSFQFVPQVINTARLARLETANHTKAVAVTPLYAFFFTDYSPTVQVVYHAQ